MSLRGIKQIVTAVQKAEGLGAAVRRTIGVRQCREFNPFLLFDHFTVSGGLGFPEHPHRGQETVTYLLNGRIAHEDFTGAKGILYPGDLQFMTAGKGVVHSEMPVPNDDGTPVEGIQFWVDLPHEIKDIEPRYRDLRAWEIPSAVKDNVEVKVISGKWNGLESLKELAYTPVEYYHAKLGKNAVYKQEAQEGFNYMAYILKGSVDVNDTCVDRFQNVFFETEGDTIEIKNLEDYSELVLIGGKVLDQNSIHYGVFVAETEDEIFEIDRQYETMTGNFEQRRTWKTLISDGVTQEMIDKDLDGSPESRERKRQEWIKANK